MKKKILSLVLILALCTALIPLPALAVSSAQIQSTGAGTITYDGSTGGAVKSDGTLWTWGQDMTGQLGSVQAYESTQSSMSGLAYGSRNTPMQALDQVAAVAMGNDYAGAIRTDGSLWMWGAGIYGELGNGAPGVKVYRDPVKLMDDVVVFNAGLKSAAAVKTDGSLWMWGNNKYGQLGFQGGNYVHSSRIEECQSIPKKVMDNVASVSGTITTAAVRTDGSLWMWGYNRTGAVGNGQAGQTNGQDLAVYTPTKIMDGVVAAATNGSCSAALKADGSLWMWGDNTNGQMGFTGGEPVPTSFTNYVVQKTPVKVMDGVAKVSMYGDGIAVIKTDGSLLKWGSSISLGPTTPTKVADNVADVRNGGNIYVKNDGSVWVYSLSDETYNKVMDGAATAPLTAAQPGAPTQPETPSQPQTPSKPAGSQSFRDVKSGDWFYPYVTELVKVGGVSGYEDGTFRPNNSITRDAVCTILLGSLLSDENFDAGDAAQMISKAQSVNGNYWANRFIGQANLCGIEDFGFSKTEWGKPATREEIAYMLSRVYACAQMVQGNKEPLEICNQTPALIGDYASAVAGSKYENDILWLYSNGIVSGANSNGDFRPKSNATRAECCTMVVALLHPENWKQIDWDAVTAGTAPSGNQTSSGTDFKGKTRIRYSNDVAYDFCRALEQQIGIQIFYLPEWTPKEEGLLQYADIQQLGIDQEYFNRVLAELRTMKAAYDLYPEGFLKELARKKGSRSAEIILCPYTYEGVKSYGEYVYDYSDDAKKVDQIYYTGSGDSQYYSHEMGHMVMSCAAILNGWDTTCSTWESYNNGFSSYVSAYARTSRPEDWADTWAYLWHQTNQVIAGCADSGLKAKVLYMSSILDKNYSSFDSSKTPWASVLG